MKAIVITIGNEILSGDIVNKDLAVIAQIAKEYGIKIQKEITVKDDVEEIKRALKDTSAYNIVLITGGLGPTSDDVTREAVAMFLGRELVFDDELFNNVKKRIKELGIKDNPLHRNYGYILKDCMPIDNPTGIAPGILCKHKNQYIILLPGPPRELEPTLKNAFLRMGFKKKSDGIVKIYRTFGIREVELQRAIDEMLKATSDTIEIGFYPSLYGVKLKVKYPDKKIMEKLERFLWKKIGENLYSDKDEELPEVLGKILKDKNLTISVAESCTGGLVGDLITSVSGSSAYFMGGIIAYSNEVKIQLLGCNREDLEKFGAVSREIALQMADGARKKINTDIGISTTGIAGPTGGTPQKPVGLVYMGYSDGQRQEVIKRIFKGKREEIKKQAALTVIDLARRMLI